MESRPYLISTLICGGLPLAVGSFSYFAWRVTNWGVWELLGFFTLIAGLAMFLAGVGHLCQYIIEAKRYDKVPLAKIIATSAGSLMLLLVNFPVAGYFMASAIEIQSHFDVTIVNRSNEPVNEFRISGSDMEDILIPVVKPGETIIRRLCVAHRHSIDCASVTANAKQISGIYPDSWCHNGYLITIGKTITITPNDGRKDRKQY